MISDSGLKWRERRRQTKRMALIGTIDSYFKCWRLQWQLPTGDGELSAENAPTRLRDSVAEGEDTRCRKAPYTFKPMHCAIRVEKTVLILELAAITLKVTGLWVGKVRDRRVSAEFLADALAKGAGEPPGVCRLLIAANECNRGNIPVDKRWYSCGCMAITLRCMAITVCGSKVIYYSLVLTNTTEQHYIKKTA